MKLTTFLVFATTLMVSASVYSQSTRLTLQFSEITYEQLFREIEKQSEFRFAFSNSKLDCDQKIKLDVTNETLEKILDKTLPEGIAYEIIDRYVVILNAFEKASVAEILEQQQQPAVSGTVTDESGEPLPGVTVVVKGTTQGTVTNANGNYSLTNIPEEAILQFSFVGMLTQEVEVGKKSNIDVEMIIDAIGIEEVVAIGYGTARKSDLTGAVVSISSSDIEKQEATNVTQILRGGIAGVDASLSNSAKETGGLLVRGQTSLLANNSPLIVVDGMIYDGDISNINPVDIESIDVLKDASSAAVFGARAASGVILITTKKGKVGKPTININTSVGFSSLQNIQEVYDNEGYIDLRVDYWETNRKEMPEGYFRKPDNLPSGINKEQWRQYDGDSPLSDMELFFSRNKFNVIEYENYRDGKTLDWYDLIFRTGLRQNYNVGISGATDNVSYYYSLGYVRNNGFLVDEKFENFRSRFNLESQITDFLKVGINSQYSRRDESSQQPSVSNAVGQSPLGRIYNDDETYKLHPYGNDGDTNPFYYHYNDNYDLNNELVGNIFAEIKLPWGFGYRCNWINQINWESDYMFQYSTSERVGSGGSRQEYNYYKWFVDNILSWKKTISEIHKFDFTFLYNVEKAESYYGNSSNSIFEPSEVLGYHQLSFGLNPTISNNDVILTADALMARMNYTLFEKYLFTVAFRRDGYSVFGTENPWANFPSAAFAWRLSEEKFFNVDWVDNLKLRVSYGINGNRDISTYQALAYFNPYKYIYHTESGKVTSSGYYSARMANRSLRWEQTEAFNFGLDFSILNNRLTGVAEGYFMSTNDLIMNRSLPAVTGYGAITTNLGEVQNKGFELSLNSRNIQSQNFSWDSQFIFYLNRNKIKHLYGTYEDVVDDDGNVIGQKESNDYSNNWFIGQSIDRIYNYELNGIWQLGEEAEASKFGLRPGDFKIVDQNDDGKITPREDRKFLDYTSPRYKMFLVNNFTLFNNFDVSFVLDARLGYYAANNGGHIHGGSYGYTYSRYNKHNYPYWTEDNPLNEYSRLDSNNPYGASYYVNRSFVKLQQLNVGYRIPARILKPYRIKAMKLAFNLQNSLVFTAWDYWDPETRAATPMIGTFNVNITL